MTLVRPKSDRTHSLGTVGNNLLSPRADVELRNELPGGICLGSTDSRFRALDRAEASVANNSPKMGDMPCWIGFTLRTNRRPPYSSSGVDCAGSREEEGQGSAARQVRDVYKCGGNDCPPSVPRIPPRRSACSSLSFTLHDTSPFISYSQ